jgi:septal ring factor EnvC (AmiA/AmiB activator)
MATRKTTVKKISDVERLKTLIERQDDQLFQLSDELKDAKEQAEFCRKQINHYIALINILTRGS